MTGSELLKSSWNEGAVVERRRKKPPLIIGAEGLAQKNEVAVDDQRRRTKPPSMIYALGTKWQDMGRCIRG